MKIAHKAHHGQYDKAGLPYIFHPFHLAEQMTDAYTVCVALLHDVVEDTEVTLEQLESVFPQEVTEAVALMTHGKDVPYFEYVENLRSNPIARAVKLADLQHNSDPYRVSSVDVNMLQRWEKYTRAMELLK